MSTLNASMTWAGRVCLAGRRVGGLAAPLVVAGALAAGCASASSDGATAGTTERAAPTGTAVAGTAADAGNASHSATPVASASSVPTVLGGPIAAGGVACVGWPASAVSAPLSASFVPVSAERCVNEVQAVPGKGLWTTATLQRSTGDLSGLINALRQPDVTRQPGTICPAVAIAPPQVVLINAAGQKLFPRLPVGDCGMTAPAVVTALNQLSWQPISIRLIAPVTGATAPKSTPTPGGVIQRSTPTPGGVMQPG